MDLLQYISHHTGIKITDSHSVSGGDISAAYALFSEDKKYFLKVNSKPFAEKMFLEEKRGLEAVEQTNTIKVPHVAFTDSFENQSFLLMEFIESKRSSYNDMKQLGENLAKLHQVTSDTFGFEADNFIGSLPQSNTKHSDWAQFYWNERLLPQLQLAVKQNYLAQNDIPKADNTIKIIYQITGDAKPSLLHGDLWSGNYLICADGIPYLIDPAVYYGHSMVDIAMTKLFGGFGEEFYNAYHEIIPKTANYEAQIELYQLYYLLVHLNLFGTSYLSSVISILDRYF